MLAHTAQPDRATPTSAASCGWPRPSAPRPPAAPTWPPSCWSRRSTPSRTSTCCTARSTRTWRRSSWSSTARWCSRTSPPPAPTSSARTGSTRAAQALLQAEGQHESAVWLLFEALLTEPREAARLARAARARRVARASSPCSRTACARRSPRGSSDAPRERSARPSGCCASWPSWRSAGLDNPHLALAAWQQLRALSASTARASSRRSPSSTRRSTARRVELERAEQALARAGRPRAAARVPARRARCCPDLPDHWPRTIQLLREALAGGRASVEPRATRSRRSTA